MAVGPMRLLLRRVRGLVGPEAGGAAVDRDLLDRFVLHRDEGAFAALVRRHGNMVFGLCLRQLSNEHDAEDAFQATFLVLAQKAGALRRSEALAGWLHQVAYRIAVKLRADNVKRRATAPPDNALATDDPHMLAAAGEVRHVVDEELAQLPAKLRSPLLLCYVDGMTVEETATRLGWPLGTLKSRLTRGRDRLRSRLTRRGLGLPATLAVVALAPENLIASTARLATLTNAGASTAVSSPQVLGLARHALQTMALTKWKVLAVAALVAATIGLGAGLLPHLLATGSSNESQAEAKAAPAKDDDEPPHGVDRFGDSLPAGALMRLGTTRFRQGHRIVAMSLSADGKTVVTCGEHDFNLVNLWDAHTGRYLRRLDVGNEMATAAAFSTKENVVAVARESGVSLFDPATANKLRHLDGPQGRIVDLTFSGDGKLLAAAYQDDRVRLWDTATGKLLPEFANHKSRGWRVLFSPNGKILATSGYDYAKKYFVRLWDVAGGQELRQLHGHDHGILAIDFSPDGKYLASGGHYYDRTMRLWEVDSGKLVHEFPDHEASHGVRTVAFTPDGESLISASEVIRVWNVATRKELRRMPQVARHLVVADKGKTLLAAGQGAIYRWDVASGRPLDPYNGHEAVLGHVVCSPDGRLIATRDNEGGLRIWSAASGKELKRLSTSYHCNVAFSRGSKYLAGVGVDDAVKYEVKSASRAIMTGTKIRLWETATWKEVGNFKSHAGQIGRVEFFADSKTLLTVDPYNGNVRLWDKATGQETRRFRAYKVDNDGVNWVINGAALSPDGKLLAIGEQPLRDTTGLGGDPAALRVWDVATGKAVYEIEGHRNQIRGLAFSPDGKVLASSGGGYRDTIRLSEAATGRLLRHLSAAAWDVAFSADSSMLASVEYRERTVRVWDVATGQQRHEFSGHTNRVFGVAFTADGSGVLSASADTTALLWDVTGLRKGMRLPALSLTAVERGEHWAALATADAVKIHKAIWTLAADARAASFLKQHLQPAPKVTDVRIAQLIRDLDNADFGLREKATRELEALDLIPDAALREAHTKATDLEQRRRLERLLERIERWEPTGEAVRTYRALQVLERSPSPEAQSLLQSLASGDAHARLTVAARNSLERLERLR